MNVINKVVSDVRYRIPREILDKAFIPINAYGNIYNNISLDEQIINTVIKPRVLVDCNMIGGTEAVIDLVGLPQDHPDPNSICIHIPKTITQGRSIAVALAIVFVNNKIYGGSGATGNYSAGMSGMGGNNCNPQLLTSANGLLKSFDSIPVVSTARVSLIGENSIYIYDTSNLPSNAFLRCILDYDEEMSEISSRAYRYISKLSEYAVKSYVYNELIVKIDQGVLQGGANIGIFKDIISGYSDAEQNYQDYLNDTMQQVLFTADDGRYKRLIKLIVGGNR